MSTPDAQREYQRQWTARRRAEYFADKVCATPWCGSTEDLQLDHVDPTQKVHHAIWSWSAERRAVELEKCQVLCPPCHKVKTRAQLQITNGYAAFRHGTRSMYYAHQCKCGLCLLWERNRKRRLRARQRDSGPGWPFSRQAAAVCH